MEFDWSLVIALGAMIVSVVSVWLQRRELSGQREQLTRSAEAADRAQEALNKQNELQTLACLLNTEMHLHDFNNKGTVDTDKQKRFAKQNFERIRSLKKQLEELVKQ